MYLKYKIINKKKRILVTIIDIIGFFFFSSINLLRGKRFINKEEIKKVLVVRLAYVGDVIMTIPVLKPLKEIFPRAEIFFLTGEKETQVLKNNNSIDHILIYNAFWFYHQKIRKGITDYLKIIKKLRHERFDLAIDFRGDIRDIFFILFLSNAHHRISYSIGGGGYLLTHEVPYEEIKHKISYHLDILKSLNGNIDNIYNSKPEIFLADSEEKFPERILNDNQISSNDLVIGIHPGGRKKLKCWDPENWKLVIERLIKEFKAKIIITGAPDEIKIAETIRPKTGAVISLCGKTTLRELASLIKGFDLFITGDSSPMHISSAMSVPTIAIFGPSKSRETGPYGKTFRVVEKEFPCRFSCDEDVCNYNIYHACMKTITPDDVYLAAYKEIITLKKWKIN